MARAHTLDACLRSESLIKHFTDSTTLLSPPLPSRLALWPASLTAEQACFYKAAVKRGESRYGRSWGLFRRSKILHRSVYSTLWLGGLRCQCRRQTNRPLTAPLSLRDGPWPKKKKKKKNSVGPFSASAHLVKCPVCPITSPALPPCHAELRQ